MLSGARLVALHFCRFLKGEREMLLFVTVLDFYLLNAFSCDLWQHAIKANTSERNVR